LLAGFLDLRPFRRTARQPFGFEFRLVVALAVEALETLVDADDLRVAMLPRNDGEPRFPQYFAV
jgi:hypothetical protein